MDTLTGWLVPAVIIGIALVAVIAIVLFRKRSKTRISLIRDTDTSPHVRHPLDYQPKSKTVSAIQPPVKSADGDGTTEVPKPKNIDLTSNRQDLTESLTALAQKYSLNNFTIATGDGLLFGSSGGDTALVDAATYSGIFKSDPLARTPGVSLFGITHKGSDLVGIVRAKTPLKNEVIQQIAADTQVVLNWWI
ncbi:MAG: hypothetical protein CVV30_01910 [Methanomicrobiales archaeon HGW-Methanomicrobiales-1]|jgi:hypothetical protein|nr:MAG: hypothetical protein CVV30_01910 [Methanomicrobiales archaeon HGW-Methanomicrobiales-1]